MGTSDEWVEDGSPAGGVGTITRPAGEPATRPAIEPATGPTTGRAAGPATGPAVEPGERGRRRPPGAPGVQPRRTSRPRRPPATPRGAPPREPKAATGEEGARNAPGARRWQDPGARKNTQRVPFFLLLCGLLGGALVCALVISTTLAEGSFRITRLQQANTELAKQRQLLAEQVAAAQSAQVIQSRARQLGMAPVGEMRFLNLRTGTIATDAGRGSVADIHVPGYTP